MFLKLDEKSRNSFELVKQSGRILMRHPDMLALPFLAGLSAIAFGAYFFQDINMANESRGYPSVALIVACTLTFFCTKFLFTLAQAGVIAVSHYALRDDSLAAEHGLSLFGKNALPIIIWAFFAATVGTLLSAAKGKRNVLRRLLVSVAETAWNFLNTIALPLVVIERNSPREGLHRASQVLRATWGENLIGRFSVGIVFFTTLYPLAFIISFTLTTTLASSLSFPLFIILFFGPLLLVFLVEMTLNSIYITALYQFALTGKVSPSFNEEFITQAFVANNESVQQKK